MNPKNLRPSPQSLLLEARGVTVTDAPINLAEYEAVIVDLRRKNYPFSKIADWLTERLGRPVNKGGVYRVYSDWEQREPEKFDPSEYEEISEEEAYARAVHDFALYLAECADDYEKTNKCRGFADEALEKASAMVRQRMQDEKEADKVDASKPTSAAGNVAL